MRGDLLQGGPARRGAGEPGQVGGQWVAGLDLAARDGAARSWPVKVLVIEPISMGVVDVYCWPEAAVLMEPDCPGALTGTIQSSSHPVNSCRASPTKEIRPSNRCDVSGDR